MTLTFVNSSTSVLNLENANPLFLSQELVRRNYLVKWAEILNVTLLGDSAWDSRGVFGYSTWGPSNVVPLGVPKEVSKILKNFLMIFQNFLMEMGPWTSK